MKRIVIASVVMMLLSALAAQAQTPPGPEHKKLGVLIGTWMNEGKDEATPFGKGGAYQATETCAWFTGEYQVVCDSEGSGYAGNIKGHMLVAYSVEKKHFLALKITSDGSSGLATGRVDGSDWTWTWASPPIGGKTYQFRLLVKYPSPNEYTYKLEFSEDGKSWKLYGEGKSAKR